MAADCPLRHPGAGRLCDRLAKATRGLCASIAGRLNTDIREECRQQALVFLLTHARAILSRDPASLCAYCETAVLHAVVDALCAESAHYEDVVSLGAPGITDREAPEPADQGPPVVERALAHMALLDQVGDPYAAILRELSPREIAALDLRYRGGLNCRDIGNLLGITHVAARHIISRALGKIRRALRLRSGGG